MIELPPPGATMVAGLKLAVVPVGTPLADRFMELLNPPLTEVVMVELLAFPCTMLVTLGFAEIVKLGGAITVRLIVTVRWSPPPAAVTVMG